MVGAGGSPFPRCLWATNQATPRSGKAIQISLPGPSINSLLGSSLEVNSLGCSWCLERSSDSSGRHSTVEEGKSVGEKPREMFLWRFRGSSFIWDGFKVLLFTIPLPLASAALLPFCSEAATAHEGENSQTLTTGIPCLGSQWKMATLRKSKA